MPVSASVQHSSATASSGRLLTVRPSAATPSRITAACWASSATMTGSALPASSSTGWVAGALTRLPRVPDPLGQDRAAADAHREHRERAEGVEDRLRYPPAGAPRLLLQGVQQ